MMRHFGWVLSKNPKIRLGGWRTMSVLPVDAVEYAALDALACHYLYSYYLSSCRLCMYELGFGLHSMSVVTSTPLHSPATYGDDEVCKALEVYRPEIITFGMQAKNRLPPIVARPPGQTAEEFLDENAIIVPSMVADTSPAQPAEVPGKTAQKRDRDNDGKGTPSNAKRSRRRSTTPISHWTRHAAKTRAVAQQQMEKQAQSFNTPRGQQVPRTRSRTAKPFLSILGGGGCCPEDSIFNALKSKTHGGLLEKGMYWVGGCLYLDSGRIRVFLGVVQLWVCSAHPPPITSPTEMKNFSLEDYYKAFKGAGSNHLLRRLQATDSSIFKEMDSMQQTQWKNFVTALSEFDFGFPILQSICHNIVVPVRIG